MVRANLSEKELVVDILFQSFIDNKSINYIIKQDEKRASRIMGLLAYSFDICYLFGDVFLSDDKKGCALILMPDKKRTTVKSILLDVKLALSVIGLSNIKKAISRESAVNKMHPEEPIYYLWFIGVQPTQQGRGVGSNLLNEIIQEGQSKRRTICLETSTLKNIPWYEKHGFKTYREMDFGYKLYCMKMP